MFFNTGAGALGYAYLAEVPAQKWRARTAGFGAAMAGKNINDVIFLSTF